MVCVVCVCVFKESNFGERHLFGYCTGVCCVEPLHRRHPRSLTMEFARERILFAVALARDFMRVRVFVLLNVWWVGLCLCVVREVCIFRYTFESI